jgi:hypothetical protein
MDVFRAEVAAVSTGLFPGSVCRTGVEAMDASLVAAIGELDHGGWQQPAIHEPIEEIGLNRIQDCAAVESRFGGTMVGLGVAGFFRPEEPFGVQAFQEGHDLGPRIGIVDLNAD